MQTNCSIIIKQNIPTSAIRCTYAEVSLDQGVIQRNLMIDTIATRLTYKTTREGIEIDGQIKFMIPLKSRSIKVKIDIDWGFLNKRIERSLE